MTRKDYKALAKAISYCETFEYPWSGCRRIDKDLLIDQISEVLWADNNRFNKDKFAKACNE